MYSGIPQVLQVHMPSPCHHSRGAVRATLITMGLVSIGISSVSKSLFDIVLGELIAVLESDLGSRISGEGNRAEIRELV